MDDLDHCVHIAERDWHSFYEETEECWLLQPTLAGQDDSSFSDSDDSGKPAFSVPDTDQQEMRQSAELNAEVLIEPLGDGGLGVTPPESHRPSEIELDHLRGNNLTADLMLRKSTEQDTELRNTSLTNDHTFKEQYVIAEPVNDECSASGPSNYVGDTISSPVDGAHNATVLVPVLKSVGELSRTSDVFSTGHIPQSASTHCQHVEKNMNPKQPCSPDRAVCERNSPEAPRIEKERWFVTVNDSPVQHRPNAVPLVKKKKKKRKRKTCRSAISESQEPPNDSGPEKDRINYPEGEDIPQSYHNSHRNDPSLEFPLEITDSSKSLWIDPFNNSEKSESISAGHSENTATHSDIFTKRNENPPQMDGIDFFKHLNDDAEFFSTASYDSEDYISATGSMEELQNDAQCNISLMTQSLSDNSAFSSSLKAKANLQSPVEENYLHCALPHEGEGYESTTDQANIEPTKTCPRSGCSDSMMMPEDSSTITSDSEMGHSDNNPPTDYDILGRASVARDPARSANPPLPALTVTACSVTQGPETLTDALDPTRPVYAISAFWDEMEKLTINDILQLRTTRIPSPTGEAHSLQATARAQLDDNDNVENSCVADTAEYALPDNTLIDISDTADSDYFTQIDDSKQDRSSCEFSTFSDFDEESYLQFLGASTNPSPEPQDFKLQSEISTDPPYLRGSMHEDIGQADPKDVEENSEDRIQNILPDDNTFLRGLTKNKSLSNVHTFGTETQLRDASLNSISEEAERSMIHSPYQDLEDTTFLDVNDTIIPRTRIPSPIITNTDILDEHYQISFPEVFEYLFVDDEPTDNSQMLLSVYDSQHVSVPETYNYSLPKYGAGMLFPKRQCSEGEPLPIFSCSHPAATFSEFEDLLFPHDTYVQFEEDEDGSPIRVVTRNDIHAKLVTSSIASEGYRHLFPRQNWRSWLSLRRLRFPGNGSGWCRRSGAWMIPPVSQTIMKPLETNQTTEVIDETSITSLPTRITSLQVIHIGQQFFRELDEQQGRFKAIQTTVSVAARNDGPLFTLRQSDMCLVCIAFASWVLRSTDPQASDAWKTALLANVSAISAIQYLRRYMTTRPSEEEL